jgi:hypothetical protein
MKKISYLSVLILLITVLIFSFAHQQKVEAVEETLEVVADVEEVGVDEYVDVTISVSSTYDVEVRYLRLDLAYPIEGGHFDTNMRCDVSDTNPDIECDYISWSYFPSEPISFEAGKSQEFIVRVKVVNDVSPAYSEIEPGQSLFTDGLNWGVCLDPECNSVDNNTNSTPFELIKYVPLEVEIIPTTQSVTQFDTYFNIPFTIKTNRDRDVQFEYILIEFAYPLGGGEYYESGLRCNPNIGSSCDAISLNYWEGVIVPPSGLSLNHDFMIVDNDAPAYVSIESGDSLRPSDVTWSVCLDSECDESLRRVSENENVFARYFENPNVQLPAGTTIEYSNPTDAGTTVIIYRDGIPVAEATIDRTSDTYDWNTVSVEIDQSSHKSVISGLSTAPGASGTHSLLIPYDSSRPNNDLWICPDAQTLEEVSETCTNGYSLTVEDSRVSLVEINGNSYWKVSGLTGTGGTISGTDSLASTGLPLNIIMLISLITIFSFVSIPAIRSRIR